MKKPRKPQYKKYILALSFDNHLVTKTGIPRVMLFHQEMYINAGISYISLFTVKKYFPGTRKMLFCTYGLIVDGVFQGLFYLQDIINYLASLESESISCLDFHIHHLLHTKINQIKKLVLSMVGVPLKVFVHDYYFICPSYNLVNSDGEYCGGNCKESCQYAKYRKKLREQLQEFLNEVCGEATFVAPSEICKQIFLTYYPDFKNRVKCIPHLTYELGNQENLSLIEEQEPIRVAYIGNSHTNKGWDVWKKLAIQNQRQNYEFFVFQSSKEHYEGMTKVQASFDLENPNAMMNLLREKKIHMAFLWSTWPETYSFTCFEAYGANAFIITSQSSGNIAATVKNEKNGIVFQTEDEMLQFFQDDKQVRDKINQFRKGTSGGPVDLWGNEEILRLSLENKEEIAKNGFLQRKASLGSRVFLRLLEKIYLKKKC